MQHYDVAGWQPLMLVALLGAIVILAGIVLTGVQLVVSIRTRDQRRDLTGDPWDGRTLEWSTPSPPPAWNYSVLPSVNGLDAYWEAKKSPKSRRQNGPDPETISVPRNSPIGFVLAFFCRHDRLCIDLAYLVDGYCRIDRGSHNHSCPRLARFGRGRVHR